MKNQPIDEQMQDVADHILDRTLGDRVPSRKSRKSETSGSQQMGDDHRPSSQQQAAVTFRDWAAI